MPRPSASDKGGSRTPIDRLAATIGSNLVPLGRGFSYFSAVPLGDDDLREYLNEPIAALPPAVCEIVAPVRVVIAPYLEREDPDGIPRVAFDPPPPEKRLRSAFLLDNDSTLFFATRDETPSDYHQAFFNTLAHLLSRRAEKATLTKYSELLVAEIEHHVHGEVDEPSWERKRNLPPASGGDKPNTKSKAFREYAAQSFADTMTLYMHGICCDIDVETGPRQMPSRWLRKRLEALYLMFAPPQGRPVLPEHLTRRGSPT
jgi:hypothetical protein